MRIDFLLRTLMVLVLSFALAIPATSQSGSGKIGASNGEIAGALVGAGAVIGVVAVVIYRKTHKHPAIVGCVNRGAEGLMLTNQKNNKIYALTGDAASLKPDEQVAVKGREIKDSSGKLSFQVEKITKEYGACHP
jgi:hypothetical protein